LENKFDVYIGWDSREPIAYDVSKKTLLDRASIPVGVHPIKLGLGAVLQIATSCSSTISWS
jgi:hypothetical protein